MAKSYEGYTIHTGFLGGNLTNESGLDLDASCSNYAEMLTEALRTAYPGAEVTVDYEVNASGSLPCTLGTWVKGPDGRRCEERDADVPLPELADLAEIVLDVQSIAGSVWEAWDWAAYEEAQN